jgi:energy-coupling factor transporter ATP-binding protein EcfA2
MELGSGWEELSAWDPIPRWMRQDEPTTGLDSATAFVVVKTIKRLQALFGCTVLLTIHQPSPSIYDLFDRVIMLHYGRVCYFGDGFSSPIAFFAQQARPSPPPLPSLHAVHPTLSPQLSRVWPRD